MSDEFNASFGKKRRVRIDSQQQLENVSDNAPSAPSQSKLQLICLHYSFGFYRILE